MYSDLLPRSEASLPSVREDEDQIEDLHDGFFDETHLKTHNKPSSAGEPTSRFTA